MNMVSKTQNMVLTAVLAAIIIILAFTPLGYIPLGFMNATTVHIPVIIGAVLLGPKYGGLLGLIFGLTSVWKATTQPIITSFVFSPFVEIGGVGGNGWSLVTALVPRILIGVVAWLVFRACMRWFDGKKKRISISLAAAGVAGSLTNTVLVMGCIYLFFGSAYGMAVEPGASRPVYLLILSVVCINGAPEAVIAGILTAAIGKALWIAGKKN